MRAVLFFLGMLTFVNICASPKLGYWYHDKFICLSPDKSSDRKFILARDSGSQNNMNKLASIHGSDVMKKMNEDRYIVRSDIHIPEGNFYESEIYLSEKGEKVIILPRIVVTLKDGYDISVVLNALNGKATIERNTNLRFVLSCNMNTSDEVLESILLLSDIEGIKYYEPEMYQNCKVTNTLYSSQYYLKNNSGVDINVEPIWAVTNGSSDIIVAVIDQGVEHDHEDLVGHVLSGYTIRNNTGYGEPQNDNAFDKKAHGTACAGIIAASNNTIGIRGIASNVNILPIIICPDYPIDFDHLGFGTNTEIADAIYWAFHDGNADVISCSCRFPECNDIEYAVNETTYHGRNLKGCVFVASSGNTFLFNNLSPVDFPASLDEVLAVGAVQQNGSIWSYSKRGNKLNLVAPSGLTDLQGDIVTTDLMNSKGYNTNGNYVDCFGGTSAACPQVAGVAALMLSVNPNLSRANVCSILQSTATDLGTVGFDTIYGYGLVNASKAVVAAFGGFPGTYYNGQMTKSINYPYPLYVLPGTDANILSPLLKGAVVSYTGDATPTVWSHNSTSGQLHVGMPSYGGSTIVVQVTCVDGSVFYLPILKSNSLYSITITVTEGVMEIILKKTEEREDGLITESQCLVNEDTAWKMEVYNASTGKIVFSQTIEGATYKLETTGLPPGVYIVRAIIGDEILSEKVVVK